MAYISKENSSQIREALKDAFPDQRFSVKINNHSSIDVACTSGKLDLNKVVQSRDGREYECVNCYLIDKHYKKFPEIRNFLLRVVEIIKYGSDNQWYDKSDPQTDYFHTAFYVKLSIGDYDKPYVHNSDIKPSAVKRHKLSDTYKEAAKAELDRIISGKYDYSPTADYQPLFNRDDVIENEKLEEDDCVTEVYKPATEETIVEVERSLTETELLINASNEATMIEILEVIREAATWIDGTIEIKTSTKTISI